MTVAEIAQLAHLLAFVVIANRRHTDLFEWGQRTTPFSLSAEIQRRLLPGAFTCEASAFTLSGWLEPAAMITPTMQQANSSIDSNRALIEFIPRPIRNDDRIPPPTLPKSAVR